MIDADDLPAHWKLASLGAVTMPSAEKVEPSGYPEATYIGLEHIEAHTRRIIGRGEGRDVKSAKSVFRAGDVLYGKLRPYLNKVAVPSFDGIASTDILVFPETSELTSGYLARLMNSSAFVELAHHASAGMELPRTSWKALREVEIPLPPVPEQRQIVERLDAIDERLASANGRLGHARAALTNFPRRVLSAACSGRLTERWRAERETRPGDEWFTNVTAERGHHLRKGPAASASTAVYDWDFPEGWQLCSLDAVTNRITSGSRDWSKYYGSGSGRFVMAQNVRPGLMDWSFQQLVDPPVDDASRERSQIVKGDLLVTIVGANTGDVAPVLDDRPECYVCQSVALARPIDPDWSGYLNLWFNSIGHGQLYFRDCIYGAGRPHLSFDQLRAAPVVVPPPDEQREIVRRVEVLLKASQDILAKVDAASSLVDRTGQAALTKAFRGELVEPRA